MESNGRREDPGERPLTIAMVVDSVGNQGNGTSNSALQWARELERQGHTVRLVGVGHSRSMPNISARLTLRRTL